MSGFLNVTIGLSLCVLLLGCEAAVAEDRAMPPASGTSGVVPVAPPSVPVNSAPPTAEAPPLPANRPSSPGSASPTPEVTTLPAASVESPADHPPESPAEQKPQPEPEAPPEPADPVTALLDRIEAETNQVRTLRARLRYTVVQGLLGDEQVRFGDLWYAAPDAFPEDPPGQTAERLAVHLQREKIDGRFGPADQWLIFDGSFFLERDESARRATRRALRPERDDQPAAALPVPIRLDRAEAQRRFEIVQLLGDARPGDAPEGISLAFTPRPGVDARPVRITFDADSLLPLEVRFGEPDGDLTVFRLIEPELNPDGIPRERFDTALPAGSGWDNQSVPFEG